MEFTQDIIRDIYYNEYIKNGMTLKSISEKYNTYAGKISRLFKENDLPIIQRVRKYSANFDYFEKIDNEEKAYWLGFLYADGCVQSNRNSIYIGLAMKDYEHIVAFNKALNSNYPIQIHTQKLPDGRDYKSAIVTITSRKLKDDLIKAGCIPRKTFECKFPTDDIVPPYLVRHFIRGVFDGDGCVTCDDNNKICVSIAGNINIVTGIQNELFKSVIVEKPPTIKSAKTIYTVNVFGKYNSMRIMEYFYKDASIYLERKYMKFEYIKNLNLKNNYPRYKGIEHKCCICGDENSIRYIKWHKEDEYKNMVFCNKHYDQLYRHNTFFDNIPYCRPLIYCLNAEKIFNTQKEAAEWAGLKSSNGIRSCIEGRQKTAGHHPETGELLQWAEYDENKLEEFKNYKYDCTKMFDRIRERPIYQLDINTGEILRKFMSSCEAGRWLGKKNFSNITSCCKGRRNHAYGFRWVYVDEFDSLNLTNPSEDIKKVK